MPGIVPRGTKLLEHTRFSVLDLERVEQATMAYCEEVGDRYKNTEETIRILAERLKMKEDRVRLALRLRLCTEDVQRSFAEKGLEYEILAVVIYRAPDHNDRRACKIVFRNQFARQIEDTFWMTDSAPVS